MLDESLVFAGAIFINQNIEINAEIKNDSGQYEYR
jgi:hypothetical protein